MYTLNDVNVGDVYVIEIVPSSALGNGSAAATTISKPHTCVLATMEVQLFQERMQVNYCK